MRKKATKSKTTREVPARKRAEPKSEFVYIREQKLPQSILQGYTPMYSARTQLKRFAPDATYEKVEFDPTNPDAPHSDEVFNVYRVPRKAHEAMMKGLANEANARLKLIDDTKLETKGGTRQINTIDQKPATLGEVGASLPIALD